jgi:hypothetical protein
MSRSSSAWRPSPPTVSAGARSRRGTGRTSGRSPPALQPDLRPRVVVELAVDVREPRATRAGTPAARDSATASWVCSLQSPVAPTSVASALGTPIVIVLRASRTPSG